LWHYCARHFSNASHLGWFFFIQNIFHILLQCYRSNMWIHLHVMLSKTLCYVDLIISKGWRKKFMVAILWECVNSTSGYTSMLYANSAKIIVDWEYLFYDFFIFFLNCMEQIATKPGVIGINPHTVNTFWHLFPSIVLLFRKIVSNAKQHAYNIKNKSMLKILKHEMDRIPRAISMWCNTLILNGSYT